MWLLENLNLFVACILVSAGLCPLRTVRVRGHEDGLELVSNLRSWLGPENLNTCYVFEEGGEISSGNLS